MTTVLTALLQPHTSTHGNAGTPRRASQKPTEDGFDFSALIAGEFAASLSALSKRDVAPSVFAHKDTANKGPTTVTTQAATTLGLVEAQRASQQDHSAPLRTAFKHTPFAPIAARDQQTHTNVTAYPPAHTSHRAPSTLHGLLGSPDDVYSADVADTNPKVARPVHSVDRPMGRPATPVPFAHHVATEQSDTPRAYTTTPRSTNLSAVVLPSSTVDTHKQSVKPPAAKPARAPLLQAPKSFGAASHSIRGTNQTPINTSKAPSTTLRDQVHQGEDALPATRASALDAQEHQPTLSRYQAPAEPSAPVFSSATPSGPSVSTNTVSPAMPLTTLSEPVHSTEWGPQLGKQLITLVKTGTATTQRAELHLNPPELGPLRITISVQDAVVHAAFQAPLLIVRQALELALPQLHAQLEQEGLSLGHTSVGHEGSAPQEFWQSQKPAQLSKVSPVSDAPMDELASPSNTQRRPNTLINTFA